MNKTEGSLPGGLYFDVTDPNTGKKKKYSMTVTFMFNMSRLWHLVLWSNTSLDVAVKESADVLTLTIS